MEPADVVDDIALFVHDRIHKLAQRGNGRRLYINDTKLASEIASTLIEKSDGMFLWVSLQLDNICRISRAQQDYLIREALTKLPRGLDSTYLRVLERIGNDDPYMKDLALRCLMWVLFAERPLREVEVQHALAISAQSTDISCPVNVFLDACGNLLTAERGVVRPIHFTVKEFFLNHPLQEPFNCLQDSNLVHSQITLSCLQCITNTLVDQGPWENPFQIEKFFELHPLAFYACRSFDYHAVVITEISHDLWVTFNSLFDLNEEHLGALLQIRCIRDPFSFTEIVSSTRLINSKANANAVFYRTRLLTAKDFIQRFAYLKPPPYALHQAAAGGHVEVCARLIEKGYAINEQDPNGITPLYHACFEGHDAVVSLLLRHRANVHAEGGYYDCALQAAVSRGSLNISKMLIEHGALVDGTESDFGSPLIIAAREGYLGLVELLLSEGAEVNVKGGPYYGSPLEVAALRHKEILEMLLLHPKISVNFIGGHFGTALIAATAKGRIELVWLLLRAGAKVNLTGGYYGTACHAACAEGREEIFRILLDHGANPEIQGGHYGTCLQAASLYSRTKIVHLLLDHNIDVNNIGGNYGTALQGASFGGSAEIVQILLENGANVNTESGEYGTALQAASAGGNSNIVLMLLKSKASVNASCGYFGTALQAAAYWAYKDIFQILLDHGADFNIQGGHYGNALQAASARGCSYIVKQLLEKGADPLVRGGKYGTALEAASEKGHVQICEIIKTFKQDL